MNDTAMTIVGNLVDEPRLRVTKNGHSVANFRVASTSRRYDAEQSAWVDNATLFVTVTCWRALAENVVKSLHKGQAVVVNGRFYMREYVVEEATRASYELEATAVGHDLTRGVAEFRRISRPPVTSRVNLDSDGIPHDDSDHFLDLAGGAEGDLASELAEAAKEPEFAVAS
jgi:single-strand DNA-binding protein